MHLLLKLPLEANGIPPLFCQVKYGVVYGRQLLNEQQQSGGQMVHATDH